MHWPTRQKATINKYSRSFTVIYISQNTASRIKEHCFKDKNEKVRLVCQYIQGEMHLQYANVSVLIIMTCALCLMPPFIFAERHGSGVALRTLDYENPGSNPGCGVNTLGKFFHSTLLQFTQLFHCK